MITVKAIFDENGTAYPEYVPETNLGNNFDGVNYVYFETEDEKIVYYKQLDALNGSN